MEFLSSSVLSEELSILLLLLSVLGYGGFQDHADWHCFLPFLSSYSFCAILHLEGSLTLYTSFQSILTLHLFIVQVITRVLIPSVTFSNPLWVAAIKAALFKGPLLINAARTLVGCIQCGGDSSSLNCSHTIPPCVSFCARPFFWGRSRKVLLMACRPFLLGSGVPRTKLSSASSLECLGFLHASSGIFPLSARALSPAQSGPGSSSSLAPHHLFKENKMLAKWK